MKPRKIPMRMCAVTREKHPKGDLIRVVKTDNGIVVDKTGKVNGRGTYLKKDLAIFEKAKKNKVLNKQFEIEVPDEIFDELKKTVD